MGNPRRRLLKTPVEIDPPPDLQGFTGRDVIGFQFPLREDRELNLRVQVFPVGTVALGLGTGAPALDERAGEHLAQSAQTADKTTAHREAQDRWA